MSDDDAKELERFTIFLRAAKQCEDAGVNRHEALHAIAADLYMGEFADGPLKEGHCNGS